MKKIIVLLMATISILSCTAQNGALKGSGKIVNKTFAYNNFTKIEFLDLDGVLEVSIGEANTITVAIDDNLENLLDLDINDQTLTVQLKGNYENRKYVEDTKIKVKITVPSLNEIMHRGNSSLLVNGITGERFKIKNTGNGSAQLNGTVHVLEVICRSNGTVNAKNVDADILEVRRSGNGNVYTNAKKVNTNENTGNGEVVQHKEGKDSAKEEVTVYNTRLAVTLKNETNKTVHLSVKYPEKGSYGISLKPYETMPESFPIGTKIYKGNQFTAFKKALFTIKDQTTLTIK
jgi:Putative auto-transporter adhesin, head GIN domain